MLEETLLEKAKAVAVGTKRTKTYSNEDVELVMAWFENEVSIGQAAKAIRIRNSVGFYQYAMKVLKYARAVGKITLVIRTLQ